MKRFDILELNMLTEGIEAGKTAVRHLGDDWVALERMTKEDRPGWVWLNVGGVGGPPTSNVPVFIPYGDAIYKEPITNYINKIPISTFRRENKDTTVRVPIELQNPENAWEYVADHDYMPNKNLEYFIAENPKLAYQYVDMVLRPRQLPASNRLEDGIAKDAKWSYFYATNIIKKPFPKGEPIINKSMWYAEKYKEFIESL